MRLQKPKRSKITPLLIAFCFIFLLHRAHHLLDPVQPDELPAVDPELMYGRYPQPDDPFLFLPCTDRTLPPALDDATPKATWANLFDPNPSHWNWGNKSTAQTANQQDPHAGRGIYLCGYLDVPLDYGNKSDTRIVRQAVTKYQVSGLARADGSSPSTAGKKSERTIVIEPGGPGGSGTEFAWRGAEPVTERFSDGQFDVLGWDPRGVNATQPAISCFPYNANRDHWSLLTGQYREALASPREQLEIADAMNDAVFKACLEMHGDIPRFLSTTLVARDLEELRKAIGEPELTGYLVSYGTGIGQTYAALFPDSVGRMILDGTEYVKDHRILGGFGFTALDNGTDAWNDGFIGECIAAGPDQCALAKQHGKQPTTVKGLSQRMQTLIQSLLERPIPGYTESGGPSLITYSALVQATYGSMYNAKSWPALAEMLAQLEEGNATLAATYLDKNFWEYDPTLPCAADRKPSSEELGTLVICADAYDAPLPTNGLDWWDSLWANMTERSWIAGNSRFFNVFPCQQFIKYWPKPSEVYRGDLSQKLKNPILLLAETHDPATPLRNGRRLLEEMGQNARLVAHHGYGHSSRDTSNCTEAISRAYIMNGTVPVEQETACYANDKPYRYNKSASASLTGTGRMEGHEAIAMWREHLRELGVWNPELLP